MTPSGMMEAVVLMVMQHGSSFAVSFPMPVSTNKCPAAATGVVTVEVEMVEATVAVEM